MTATDRRISDVEGVWARGIGRGVWSGGRVPPTKKQGNTSEHDYTRAGSRRVKRKEKQASTSDRDRDFWLEFWSRASHEYEVRFTRPSPTDSVSRFVSYDHEYDDELGGPVPGRRERTRP